MNKTYPVSRGTFNQHTTDTNIHLSSSERNILQPGMDMPDFSNLITLDYSDTTYKLSKIYKINAPGYFFYGNAGIASNAPAGIFVTSNPDNFTHGLSGYFIKNGVLCYHMCASEGKDYHTHLIPIYPGENTYFLICAESDTMKDYNFMFIPTVGVVSYLKSIEKFPSDAISDTTRTLDSIIGSSSETICTMIDGTLDTDAVERIQNIFSGDWRDNFLD